MDAGRHFVSFEFLVLIAFIMDSNYGFDDFLSGAGATDFSQFFDAGAEDCNDSSFEGTHGQTPVDDFSELFSAGAGDFNDSGFEDTHEQTPVEDSSQLFSASTGDSNDSSFEGSDEQIPVEDFMAFLAALNPATSSSDALGASSAPSTPPLDASSSSYAPHPHIFAQQPESAINSSPLYSRLTSPRFRTSAEAKAHRRHARVQAKSEADDILRVKSFGRDYWVCRIYNAMICTQQITDSNSSTHRNRFTKQKVFDELELEAAAHNVFDKAIAVHERGWTRPKVYHKNTVRGKLVDKSEKSLEMRLNRICLLLKHTKSAVDDVMRGGLTLALLCDNPEARKHTKESNDVGNAKRGERLKQTSTKKTVAPPTPPEEEEVVEVEGNEE